MRISTRAASAMLYLQAAFLLFVTVAMVGIVFEPPAGGTKAITGTVLTFAYAVTVWVVAFRLARGRRHVRLIALVLQLLPASAALYLIIDGRWFGWFSVAYILVLILLLSLGYGVRQDAIP